MNLTPEQSKRYKQMADEHAEFLCEQMFKPVFKMAFLHGAKHMFEEVMTGPGFTTEVQINMPNWSCPRCNKTYEDNTLACPECQSLNPNAFVDDDPDDPPSDPTEDELEKESKQQNYQKQIKRSDKVLARNATVWADIEKQGNCFFTVPGIHKRTGLDRRRITRAIEHFIDKDKVVILEKGFKSRATKFKIIQP